MTREQEQQDTLKRLLQQEVSCFNEILQETETFYNQLDSFSLEAIIGLLNARQRRIDFIADLEERRRKIKTSGYQDPELEVLVKSISELAQTLVVIDARILDILQSVKSQYLDRMADLAHHQKGLEQLQSNRNADRPRIIDIIQK
jgi:hypothetical protein